MRMRGMVARALLCTAVFAGAEGFAAGHEGQRVRQRESAAPVVPGVVIVKLRQGASAPDISLFKGSSPLSNGLRKAGVTDARPMFPSAIAAASEPSAPTSRLSPPGSNASAAMPTASVPASHLSPSGSNASAAAPIASGPTSQLSSPGSGALATTPSSSNVARAEALARLSLFMECSIPADADPAAVAEQLSHNPSVEYAEPKYLHTLCDTPDDPLFGSQPAFTQLNAAAGWSLGKGSSSVLIAAIDGGTFWTHEDLLPNLRINAPEDVNGNGVFDAADLNGVDEDGNGFIDDVVGWNFTNNTPDPKGLTTTPQSYAHGTATASHFGAAANNGKGMTGSSWNCALLPVCVGSSSSDNGIAYGYEGIVYAASRGAHVINCSWGRIGGFSKFEQDVITAVTAAGSLVVAAAGNDNANSDRVPHYPSNYRGVLAVGATESTSDTRASFTNYGLTVPVYAPGVNILSAFTDGGYGNGGSGTSYSSPLVAGLAGILRATHPSWTPAQIAAQIRMTADPLDTFNPVYAGLLGKGRVNFARALTESHAGIDVTAATALSSSGQRFFLPGDTIIVTLTLKNVLFLDAVNVAFSASSSDAFALQPIGIPNTLGLLSPGQSVQLPPFLFKVGSVAATTSAALRLRWTVNGTDADGTAIVVWVFPSIPQWVMQFEGGDAGLFSVHAVNREVVWTAGGNPVDAVPLVGRTTDGGATWTNQTGSLSGVMLYCVYALDADRAWVGTSDGRIFATVDGGAIWNAQTYPGRQSPFINGIRMFPDGTGYAQGDPPDDAKFVLLKTTDFGATWVHLANEPVGTSGEASWNNSFWWTDQLHGWFGTNHSKVWRTTDGGASWSSAGSGAVSSFGVAFRDNSTGYAIHDNGYIARTTDGGASWAALASPTTAMISAVAAVPGTESACITSIAYPYRTRNDGAAWENQTVFPVIGSLNHISLADTGTGWIVTSNGEILKYEGGGVTGVGTIEPSLVPGAVSLDQSYPNPFNGSARIRYRVQGEGFRSLTVSVYDVLGRKIALLAQGAHAAGEYVTEFDARDRASGVYFCVLEALPAAGGAPLRLTTRMVLIR